MKSGRTVRRPMRPADYRNALIRDLPNDSVITESYRILRTNLLLSGGDSLRSIVVTSATTAEGKSITCANLGVVMSKSDKRVVIVDADLRRAGQHKIFGIHPGNYASLLEHDSKDSPLESEKQIQSVTTSVGERLDLIAAGGLVTNPAEVIGSARFAAFLQKLQGMYDLVLIDSPPVGLLTDAAVLASRVDGTIYVLDYQHTPRRAAQRAVRALENVNANIVGVVVNRTPLARENSDGGSYYAPNASQTNGSKSS